MPPAASASELIVYPANESELDFLGRQRNRVIAEDTGGRPTNFGPFLTTW